MYFSSYIWKNFNQMRTTILVFSILVFIYSSGQTIVSVSKKLELPKKDKITNLNKSYFALDGQSYLVSRNVSALAINSLGSKTKSATLSKMNEVYQLTKSEEIELKHKKTALYIEDIFKIDNKIYVIGSHVNNSSKEIHFFLNEIDPNSLKVKGELNPVGSLNYDDDGKTLGSFNLKIHQSENTDLFAFSVANWSRARSQVNMKTFVINQEGEKIYEILYTDHIKEFELFDIEQLILHDDGIVCLVNNFLAHPSFLVTPTPNPLSNGLGYGQAKKTTDYHLFFTNFQDQDTLFDIKANFPEHHAKMTLKEDDLFICFLSTRSNQYGYEFDLSKYSLSNQKLIAKKSLELSPAFMAKDKERMNNNVFNLELLHIDHLLISPKDELFVFFQDFHQKVTSTSTGNGGSVESTIYIFGQIIMFNFNRKDLKYNYSKKIMRECARSLTSIGTLFTYFNDQKDLCMIGNISNLKDLIKGNLTTVKDDQSGNFLGMRWKIASDGTIIEDPVYTTNRTKGFLELNLRIDQGDYFDIGLSITSSLKRKYAFLKLNKNV